MFIDLDGFKQVNDTYGHEEGDHVLKEVANRLKRFRNDVTFVSRLGGDEFIVMLLETDKEEATEIAADILRELQLEVNDLLISLASVSPSRNTAIPFILIKKC